MSNLMTPLHRNTIDLFCLGLVVLLAGNLCKNQCLILHHDIGGSLLHRTLTNKYQFNKVFTG